MKLYWAGKKLSYYIFSTFTFCLSLSVFGNGINDDSILSVYTDKSQNTLYFDTVKNKKSVLISSDEYIFDIEQLSENKSWALISRSDCCGYNAYEVYYLPLRKQVKPKQSFFEIKNSPQGEYVSTFDDQKFYLSTLEKELDNYESLPFHPDLAALKKAPDPLIEKQLTQDALKQCKLKDKMFYVSLFFGSKMGETPWTDLKGDSVFNVTSVEPLTCNKRALEALDMVGVKAFGPYDSIENALLQRTKIIDIMVNNSWLNHYTDIYQFQNGKGVSQ